jgi:methylated-DNA-[protein]-cysteine S-methyltransferase
MGKTYYTTMDSPVGRLLIAGDQNGVLRYIAFVKGKNPVEPQPHWEASDAPFTVAIRQLQAYFAGELTQFDLGLRLEGTPFQTAVWRALMDIPYGSTVSYGEIARRIGRPKAVRAVGAANGQNPLSIVIPCHRVVGSDGSLTGYGGGLSVKERLLELERSRGKTKI